MKEENDTLESAAQFHDRESRIAQTHADNNRNGENKNNMDIKAEWHRKVADAIRKAMQLISILLLCSCKSTTIKHTWPDKSVTEICDHRFMYEQEAAFTFSNAGTVITLNINSNPDSNAVQAAAEGAAYGAVKGIKGTP